jgi:hypothetical protein
MSVITHPMIWPIPFNLLQVPVVVILSADWRRTESEA